MISLQVLTKKKHDTRRLYQDSRQELDSYSEPEAYSEPCQVSTMRRFGKQLTTTIIFASYNYFRNISFSCLLVNEINMIF